MLSNKLSSNIQNSMTSLESRARFNLFMTDVLLRKFDTELPKFLLGDSESVDKKYMETVESLRKLKARIPMLKRRNSLGEWQSFEQQVNSTITNADKIKEQFGNVNMDLRTFLDNQVKIFDRGYSIITVISRIIYILGFGVGLVAEVVGIKGADASSG